MNDKMFQDIFDKLQNGLPKKWKKVVMYIAYTKGSYSMKYYVDDGRGSYKDCFELLGKAELIKLFMSIDAIIKPVRAFLTEKNRWNVLSLVIEESGNIKADYDYSNIDDNRISYEEQWKERYL